MTSRATVQDPKGSARMLVLMIRAAGLPAPELEHKFARGRGWRFDLAWIEQKLALEIEGGIWTQGRHSRGAGMLADMEKYNTAALLGWRVLRCTPDGAKGSRVLDMLAEALK